MGCPLLLRLSVAGIGLAGTGALQRFTATLQGLV